MTTTLAPPAPAAPAGTGIPAIPAEDLYRLTVEQYHAMLHAGILKDGDPVELLEGLLVQKMTKNLPHTFATQQLRDFLRDKLPAGWVVNDQEPVTTDTSEPEPDAAALRGSRRDYLSRRPSPQDVGLVVEVADSSLARDRGPKKRIYAEVGIVIYWIVNLVDRQIEVYTDPTGPAETPDYRQHRDYGPTQAVPLVIDGREIAQLPVQDILP